MSNIRNLDYFKASIWDWTWLNGAFGGTQIRVSDIDGMVERRGHFLMIEGKKGGVVSGGQEIMFQSWVTGGNALLLLIGMDHEDHDLIISAVGGPWPRQRAPFTGDRARVRRVVQPMVFMGHKQPERKELMTTTTTDIDADWIAPDLPQTLKEELDDLLEEAYTKFVIESGQDITIEEYQAMLHEARINRIAEEYGL